MKKKICVFNNMSEKEGIVWEQSELAEHHPAPVKREKQPSATFCCTAASAKTQYVASEGAHWQELSPRTPPASFVCALPSWLQFARNNAASARDAFKCALTLEFRERNGLVGGKPKKIIHSAHKLMWKQAGLLAPVVVLSSPAHKGRY